MSECRCTFPSDLFSVVECAQDLARMFKDGTLLTKRGHTLKHVGCILGTVGAMLEPKDPDPVFSSAGWSTEYLKGDCEESDECEDAIMDNMLAYGTDSDPQAVAMNPILLALLEKVAVAALRKLFGF